MVPKGIDSHLFECYGQIVLPYPSPSSKWGHVAELAKDSGNGGEEGYDMWERGNSLRIHHYSFSVSKFLVSQARISCFEAENVTWTHYSTLCNSVVTLLLHTYKNSATVAAILMQTLLVVWKVPNILRKDHLAQLFTGANVKTNLAVLLLNINCKVDEWFPGFLLALSWTWDPPRIRIDSSRTLHRRMQFWKSKSLMYAYEEKDKSKGRKELRDLNLFFAIRATLPH